MFCKDFENRKAELWQFLSALVQTCTYPNQLYWVDLYESKHFFQQHWIDSVSFPSEVLVIESICFYKVCDKKVNEIEGFPKRSTYILSWLIFWGSTPNHFEKLTAVTVATLNRNTCSILERASDIESSKDIWSLPRRLEYVCWDGTSETFRRHIGLRIVWLSIKRMVRTGRLLLEDDHTRPHAKYKQFNSARRSAKTVSRLDASFTKQVCVDKKMACEKKT